MSNKILFLKHFSLFSFFVMVFALSGCSHTGYNREQYFQSASKQHYQFQQSSSTKAEPAQYSVCGSARSPCAAQTPLIEHTVKHSHHKKIQKKKHHSHQGRKTECPLK